MQQLLWTKLAITKGLIQSVDDNDRRSKRFCSSAVLCVSFMWQVKNANDQISSDRRSKRSLSNCILCLPYILSGGPTNPDYIQVTHAQQQPGNEDCGLLLSPAINESNKLTAWTASVINLQGPVARSLVSANRWLRGIKMYRFPWYLTLVSTNHASSNPGLVCNRGRTYMSLHANQCLNCIGHLHLGFFP